MMTKPESKLLNLLSPVLGKREPFFGPHLSEIIDQHLAEGWHLYYRAQGLPTKEMAFEMQNRLL